MENVNLSDGWIEYTTEANKMDKNIYMCESASFGLSYTDYYHGWTSIVVCCFGVVANTLIIVILTRKHMISPTNLILTGLAVVDAMVMIVYIPFSVHLYLDKSRYRHTYSWAVFILFHANFTQVLHTISIWLTVTLAVWRCLTISQPTNQALLNSTQRAKVAILMAFFGSMIICAPMVMMFNVQLSPPEDNNRTFDTNRTVWTVQKSGSNFMKQLSFWTFAVGIKIIPCIALTFLSCYLIKAILSAQKRRKQLKANGNQNDRTTGMLVSVVILFIITELPQGILALLGAILDESFLKNCYGKLGDLMDIVALVNSAVNFVLYCCMSRQFRTTFCNFVLPTSFREGLNIRQ